MRSGRGASAVAPLASQERHGLHAVSGDVQMDGGIGVAESLLRQPDIAGTVFDQENVDRAASSGPGHDLPHFAAGNVDASSVAAVTAHWLSLCCGNLAFTSQKSLMLFTRLSNASSCTGLLR